MRQKSSNARSSSSSDNRPRFSFRIASKTGCISSSPTSFAALRQLSRSKMMARIMVVGRCSRHAGRAADSALDVSPRCIQLREPMRPSRIFAVCTLLLGATLLSAAEPLPLHVVPTPIKSYRLLAMSMDDDGFIWCGSIHRVVHRYDPRAGTTETIPMPYDSSAASCICAGAKVYILGQNYPKLIVYDCKARSFSELAYPSPKPDVWYGTPLIDNRFI